MKRHLWKEDRDLKKRINLFNSKKPEVLEEIAKVKMEDPNKELLEVEEQAFLPQNTKQIAKPKKLYKHNNKVLSLDTLAICSLTRSLQSRERERERGLFKHSDKI